MATEAKNPLEDGFLHFKDEMVLLNGEGKIIPTDDEIRRKAEIRLINAQYPDDDDARFDAILEATIKRLPERLPGEDDGLKLEQLELLQRCVEVLEAAVEQ